MPVGVASIQSTDPTRIDPSLRDDRLHFVTVATRLALNRPVLLSLLTSLAADLEATPPISDGGWPRSEQECRTCRHCLTCHIGGPYPCTK